MTQHASVFCSVLLAQSRPSRPIYSGSRSNSGVWPIRSIRIARNEDVEALDEQVRTTDWNYSQLEEEVDRDISTFLVSEDGGALRGFAVGWHVAGELQVMAIAVDGRHRRKGVGQSLLKELLDTSRRRGDITAVLEVRASNEAALALYSKLGFDVVGRRRRYYSDGEDAMLLQKGL